MSRPFWLAAKIHSPPTQPWLDRSLTAEELKALRARLSKMTEADLVKFCDAGLHMCRLSGGVPPRAAFIQQLVQASIVNT
jgi:hypothetical protein